MNLALVGYGKMGKEIERVAGIRGHVITRIFDVENNHDGEGLTRESLAGVDACVEFSTPGAVLGNIFAAARAGVNMVVGTTGWNESVDEVKKLVRESGTGLVYASNFSLGVNLFLGIVRHAARLVDPYPAYDASIHEIHHRGKADSPSGTALMLAAAMLEGLRRKNAVLPGPPEGALLPEQLHVTSTRVGNVTGTHSVLFDSDADAIELIHTAKTRAGFAMGALIAAEWLKGKSGVFTMADVIAS
jgi:4-hydroxy-tetrahydrodipicolinate reductase